MRSALDRLYAVSGALGAFFLASILLIVLAQVAFNIVDEIVERFTGEPLGLFIPSYADFAGYFLAAGTFFALAYTLNAGAHIRVNLVLQRMPSYLRQAAEVFCSALASVASGYFAFYAGLLTHESWRFGDLSPGLVAIPIWLPQTAMTAGLVMLTVTCADSLMQALRGETPAYERAGATLDLSAD